MRPRIARAVLPLLWTAALCGCVALPLPSQDSRLERDNLGEWQSERFQPGKSTREEVLLGLGEPDGVPADGSWLVFADVRNAGHWLFVVGSMGGVGGFDTNGKYVYRNLIVFFDAKGRVRELLNETGECRQPANTVSSCYSVYLGGWPAERLLLARIGSLGLDGLAVREVFVGAMQRQDERWVDGALIVAAQGVIFVETSDAGPLYARASTISTSEDTSVDWEPVAEPGGPVVLLRRRDGASHVLAFKPLSLGPGNVSAGFDRERAERFANAVRRARDAAAVR
jgi:hypothetical protein